MNDNEEPLELEVVESIDEEGAPMLPVAANDIAKDLDIDYEYTRKNLKDIIDKGSDALDGILQLAKDTDHPRAYEVVGQIIKNVADVNRQLIELQKDVTGLRKPKDDAPRNVTNALFVGSTHDLQKLLKGEKLKAGDK